MVSGVQPGHELSAGLDQDELADLVDEGGRLGDRDPLVRREHGRALLPAGERLEPDDGPAGDTHDRLVGQEDLPAGDGPDQPALEIGAIDHSRPQAVVELPDDRPALRLGIVHGGVRVAQQRVGVNPWSGMRRRGHDTDAHGDGGIHAGRDDGPVEHSGNAVTEGADVIRRGGVGADDDELVASEPADDVVRPGGVGETTRDRLRAPRRRLDVRARR